MNTVGSTKEEQQLRILLVEDDEDDYVLTRDLLSEFAWGHPHLEWVSDYESALKAMVEEKYDVHLLDYRIGADSGLELLRVAIARGSKVPVIFLTGQGDHEVDIQAMEAGAADYLVKDSIDASTLERSIRYAIQQKQTELELAEMQQRLADSREVERLHLAQELHDGPLQDLIGARFHLGILANLLKGQMDAAKIDAQMETVQTELQSVINVLRAMCGELRPPALAPFGLAKAIRAHTQNFLELHPELVIELELDEDHQELSERVRLALFRIYQQALANIAAHAEATQVRVLFRFDAHRLLLRVIDDGRGFIVPNHWLEFARDGHLGLLGAAERAESIGGHLEVISEPGNGTSLTAEIDAPHQVVGFFRTPIEVEADIESEVEAEIEEERDHSDPAGGDPAYDDPVSNDSREEQRYGEER